MSSPMYYVIEDHTARGLAGSVISYLDAGWELVGGVSVACSQTTSMGSTRTIYAQAVKKDNLGHPSDGG
jgi:hypothetical protein